MAAFTESTLLMRPCREQIERSAMRRGGRELVSLERHGEREGTGAEREGRKRSKSKRREKRRGRAKGHEGEGGRWVRRSVVGPPRIGEWEGGAWGWAGAGGDDDTTYDVGGTTWTEALTEVRVRVRLEMMFVTISARD